ncbi:acyltransferase family protein [Massilia timonae]|uniref:Acyltransferase family protein n=1 Tax=Massilia timonae TaxID=47229 RepID=A0A1S2N799_9BURK|nr:acyltransferase [Massilia timonae]OIJ40753.1 acyltransferase family protein [Massilia timonae]
MPKITLLQRANLSEDQWHSMLISLLRGLAALQVAAAHLRAQVYPGFGTVQDPSLAFQGLAFATGFAYLAVIVFFVLSGWLVGGSLLNRLDTQHAIANYAVDRVTRLWIVLIPTFGAMLLFGVATATLDPARPSFALDNAYSAAALVGNLVGLQNIVVPEFGGNFPLWSLSNETWYYVLFPLLVMLFRTRSTFHRLLILLAVAAIVHLLNEAILLYFSIWLLGAAFSRVRIECGPLLRWALFLGLVAAAVFIRLKGKSHIAVDSFVQYLLFSVVFVVFLSSMQFQRARGRLTDWVNRAGRFFSEFSFTLYVLHIPFMLALLHLAAPFFGDGKLDSQRPIHMLVYLILYLVIVAGAYLFHLPFEANTYRVREWLEIAP